MILHMHLRPRFINKLKSQMVHNSSCVILVYEKWFMNIIVHSPTKI